MGDEDYNSVALNNLIQFRNACAESNWFDQDDIFIINTHIKQLQQRENDPQQKLIHKAITEREKIIEHAWNYGVFDSAPALREHFAAKHIKCQQLISKSN